MKSVLSNLGVTLYHGRWEEAMRVWLVGGPKVQLVVADLPYGATNAAWDRKPHLPSLWAFYDLVLTRNGAVCLTACQPFTSELVCSNKNWFRTEWIWRKNRKSNFLHAKRGPLRAHESVLVFSPRAPRYFPQITDGHAPTHLAYRKPTSEVYRLHQSTVSAVGKTSRYPSTVLEIPCVNNSEGRIHPNQKPVALYEYLIRTYSQEGDTILDNCAGSGTLAIAALKLGRKAILIEGDEGICRRAEERIRRFMETGVDLGDEGEETPNTKHQTPKNRTTSKSQSESRCGTCSSVLEYRKGHRAKPRTATFIGTRGIEPHLFCTRCHVMYPVGGRELEVGLVARANDDLVHRRGKAVAA